MKTIINWRLLVSRIIDNLQKISIKRCLTIHNTNTPGCNICCKVELRNMDTGDLSVFHVNAWLSKSKDDQQLVRDIPATVRGKTSLKCELRRISFLRFSFSAAPSMIWQNDLHCWLDIKNIIRPSEYLAVAPRVPTGFLTKICGEFCLHWKFWYKFYHFLTCLLT